MRPVWPVRGLYRPVESVYSLVAKLLILGYFGATNEEWKLRNIGLLVTASWRPGFKKSGNPAYFTLMFTAQWAWHCHTIVTCYVAYKSRPLFCNMYTNYE